MANLVKRDIIIRILSLREFINNHSLVVEKNYYESIPNSSSKNSAKK